MRCLVTEGFNATNYQNTKGDQGPSAYAPSRSPLSQLLHTTPFCQTPCLSGCASPSRHYDVVHRSGCAYKPEQPTVLPTVPLEDRPLFPHLWVWMSPQAS